MKTLISTLVLALAATACVKQQGQVQEVRQPAPLKSICTDSRYSDVCTPSSNEMPTVIDINLAVPAAFHKSVG